VLRNESTESEFWNKKSQKTQGTKFLKPNKENGRSQDKTIEEEQKDWKRSSMGKTR